MDQNQKRYAIKRIDEVLATKANDLRQRFTKQSRQPSDLEKLRAIREGDVVLRRNATMSSPMAEAFDFSGLGPFTQVDQKPLGKALDLLKQQAAKVRDAVMLGDESNALKLIQSFCKE